MHRLTKNEEVFRQLVWDYYGREGRHNHPWRKTHNPYRILVSEMMLQQTQVARVLPKYTAFLKKFATVQTLHNATLGEVLRAWQGLGYNRRAKMLHTCAGIIVGEYNGKFPKTYEGLVKLPGIGPYTAGAIMAFAYNKGVPLIETNIRTVYMHHFFPEDDRISDAQLLRYIERTLDHTNPKEWYYALMDYGMHLKKSIGNLNSRSTQYAKQSAFKGSNREIRGAILRLLSEKSYTCSMLCKTLSFEQGRVKTQLDELRKESLILKVSHTYSLP